MDDIDIRRQLTDLGKERLANQQEGAAIMERIGPAVRQAVALGVSKSEIARRANISPTTLYAILNE
jgi:DNA invertase Pin-like site-specific DNA recombinase